MSVNVMKKAAAQINKLLRVEFPKLNLNFESISQLRYDSFFFLLE